MASIIPDRQLFIVTSALNTGMGVISAEDRMSQTLRGLEVLKTIVPDSIILFADGSPNKVDEEKFLQISQYVDFIADFSGDADISMFAKNHKKSEAECVLLIKLGSCFSSSKHLMSRTHSASLFL